MPKPSKQPDELPSDFGPALRQIRTAKGIGLRTLAKWADISPAYLSRIELGKVAPPSEECIIRLAEGLDYHAGKLVLMAGRIPESVRAMFGQHPLAMLRICDGLEVMQDERCRTLVLGGLGAALDAIVLLFTIHKLRADDDAVSFVREYVEEYKRTAESLPDTMPSKQEKINLASSLLAGDDMAVRTMRKQREQAGEAIAHLVIGLLGELDSDGKQVAFDSMNMHLRKSQHAEEKPMTPHDEGQEKA